MQDAGKVRFTWVDSDKNLADIFTKPLGGYKFVRARSMML